MELLDARILLTGSRGFLGQSVLNELKYRGFKNIITPTSKDYDLTKQAHVEELFEDEDPNIVIHLAANVGGILYNKNNSARIMMDNLKMGVNLIDTANEFFVDRFVYVGTVCSYPNYTMVPFNEEDLWDGFPEIINAPYGVAKKTLGLMLDAYNKQYGLKSAYVIPVNLYGPNDHFFEEEKSHVIPALIDKIYNAKLDNKTHVECWGDGQCSREFLFVKDAARGIVEASKKINIPIPINLGTGEEIKIYDLVHTIKDIIGFEGHILWNKSKPNGQPRRCMNTTRAKLLLDWEAEYNFEEGLKETIDWYLNELELAGK